MAPKKLTRKEIVQQDVIKKTLTETSSWAVENARLIAGAIILVLVTGLAVFGWETYSSRRNEALQAAFADALLIYHAEISTGEGEDAEVSPVERPKYTFAGETERSDRALEAFQKLVDENPRGTLGQLSLYYVGILQCEKGNFEAGFESLRTVIEKANEQEVRDLARHYLAEQYAAQGRSEDAIALLEAILESSDTRVPKSTVLLRLGELKEASGDEEGALDVYRQVNREYAGTTASTEATDRIRRLEPKVQRAANHEVGEPVEAEPTEQ